MASKSLAAMMVLASVVVVALIFVGGLGGSQGAPINSTHQVSQPQQAPGPAAQNASKVLFASTQYAAYSYQVYPGPLSQQASMALSGFNVSSTVLQNGTADITILLSGTSQSQTVLLKPGYKMYIIETTFGDDGFGAEYSLGDDGFVTVDPNGYIA